MKISKVVVNPLPIDMTGKHDARPVPSKRNYSEGNEEKINDAVTEKSKLKNYSKELSALTKDLPLNPENSLEDPQEQVKREAEKDKILFDESIRQANRSLAQYDRYIERTIHEGTKAIIYTIRNTKTDEVIAEFPSKKIQDMIVKMWELAGLFVDEKA